MGASTALAEGRNISDGPGGVVKGMCPFRGLKV